MPSPYDHQALPDFEAWQQRMQRKPTLLGRLTRRVQARLNALLPEKLHKALTVAIQKMVQGVLFGSMHTTRKPLPDTALAEREALVRTRIRYYRNTAAAEGAATGAGGFLLGLADFPLLLGLKLKLLFDVAALYGHDVRDFSERLFLLHIFQLAFSSQHTRNEIYQRVATWETYRHTLPTDVNEFDWRTFQQEYRDYIDLAKLAQLIPVIGAAVGAVANYKLVEQLGETAINCYRLRWFAAEKEQERLP
ncbi:EcsC family protein [Hymenobacter lutimineralis]|uniref:EcsC family protein n=1 Tax=Hymenobacter lutimineralis TaxID=2606448 RepID=A0A5D6V5K9_9BACT|nr:MULTISPECIES: EcsC family protein [Hymenobacter]QIX63037.1 EcsC family protein [Hymenobacter sp. BT18]TYZ10527.1 EcsC family protein [Hymenobacter lutimineralis]